jgi:hypothetical protein
MKYVKIVHALCSYHKLIFIWTVFLNLSGAVNPSSLNLFGTIYPFAKIISSIVIV